MENQFDLGLNIASIETELPDPVITLSGADMLTASDTAEMPLLALTVYGRSWQDNIPTAETTVDINSIGGSGSLTVTTCGKNLFDINGNVNVSGIDASQVDYNAVSGNVLTTSTNSTLSNSAGQKIRVGKGAVVTFSTKVISFGTGNQSLINIYDPAVSGAAAAIRTNGYINFTMSLTYTAKSDYLTFGFGTINGVGAQFTDIQVEIGDNVTEYEPFQGYNTATITKALPLQGVPVSSGGNYTDSSGQEWICDTLKHVYGESAKIVKRTTNAVVTENYGGRGYGAVVVDGTSSWYGDYFELHHAYSNGQYWGRLKCKNGYGYLKDGVWTQNAATSYSLSLSSDTVFYGKVIWSDSGKPYSGALPLYTLSNGDDVPDSYISTTGTLSDGAVIIYPSGEKTVTLTTKETEALSSLSGYKASTTVYNENTAEMTVKLLREDFEMQYIHWIKESQSFICEKAGKYKIICVGGGSSGGIGAPGAADVLQAVGTTTSFGSIISANGGGKSRTSASEKFEATGTVGGQSGYDGINYGSSSHILSSTGSSALSSTGSESTSMWGTGHGYGAGGGAKGILIKYTKDTAVNLDMLACGGQCGRIESTIVDLEENQTVFCTVGGGGALNLSDANVLDYLKNYVDNAITETTAKGTELSACVTDGADGVIIVQYLGV